MKKCVVIFLLVISCYAVHGQNKQGNIWYFGRSAGLDFNTDPPTILTDGALDTWEGCATLADEDGNLLFYTDGIRAWDRNHNQMPNGLNLGGNPSATQSGVIVPYPDNPDLYYLFSVDYQIGSLQYALVDLTVNGGMGDVTSKNNVLLGLSTEKISAVQHANGRDFWVVGHEWNSNRFFSWKVTDQGLDLNPVITSVGTNHEGHSWNTIGYLKFSSLGDKLAIASYYKGDFVEVLDFDTSTGLISNPVKLETFGGRGAYGLEFSPSGEFLYISEAQGSPGNVYQVKLPTTDGLVKDRGIIVASGKNIGALQLAPNGKIYLAQDNHKQLNVINKPDLEGALSDYEEDGQDLGGKRSANGLPTFIQSFFKQVDFTAQALCEGDQTAFTIESEQLADIDSVAWDFGDPGSTNNASKLLSPTHTFSASGDFTVSLIAYFDDRGVSANSILTINPLPNTTLGQDQVLINAEQYSLDLSGADTYRWQDANTDDSRNLTDAGWYWVDATSDEGCTVRDSLALFTLSYADTCFASPTQFSLNTGNIDVDSLRWNFGDVNAGANNTSTLATVNHEFSASGAFEVATTIYYNGRNNEIRFPLNIAALPQPDLGADQTLFYGETTTLDASGTGTDYRWQDDSANETFLVEAPGSYWVEVTNQAGCMARDSVVINYDQVIDVSLPADTVLCLGEMLALDVSLPDASYLWQDGSTNANFTVNGPGTYWVEITNAFGNRTKTDSILVDYYTFGSIAVEAQVVICEERSAELMASGASGNETYRWYDVNMAFLEENAGLYTTTNLSASSDYFVTLTNGRCESDPVRISVIYDQVFAEIIPADTVIMNVGESVALQGFGGESFSWSPMQWLDAANQQIVTSTPDDDIEYTLTVTSALGCTDEAKVWVLLEKEIDIPNAITPNNDGFNDFWKIRNIERYPDNSIMLFDREGNLLLEFATYQNEWNGEMNGKPLPMGTYFYIIELGDGSKEIRGAVSIIRR